MGQTPRGGLAESASVSSDGEQCGRKPCCGNLDGSDTRDADVRLALAHLIVPMPVPRPVPPTIDAADIALACLVAWYRECAHARIPERVATRVQKLGLHLASVQIRDQQKRRARPIPAAPFTSS